MNTTEYYLAFSHFLGIGPMRFKDLLTQYHTLAVAYAAPLSELEEVIGVGIAAKFQKFRNSFSPREKLRELYKKNIQVITREDPLFPPQLLEIPDPPICLYVKGDMTKFNFESDFFMGIVGTRMPTSYGAQLTSRFSRELVENGAVIVSGMAMGVDAIAHMKALDAGGCTIAFLGCGVDVVYPLQNRSLYERIISQKGLVISEFPPGMTVQKGLFVARNRLISGLSQGVLVVEGGVNSGSLITARYAAIQGKDVFAPPVPLTSSLSEGPNILLKSGATLVTKVDDILETYQKKPVAPLPKPLPQLSMEERSIIDALRREDQDSNDLSHLLGVSITKLLPTLSLLEIKGLIINAGGGKYRLKSR
ncbi:DNA-protecting protein DprA [Candidatus Roizmanbacteria bacterium]|nr:DNA-protecting protein DprA [Candidatus Roizmanbacteria bacterium]